MRVLGVHGKVQIRIKTVAQIMGSFNSIVRCGVVHLEDKMIAVVQAHPQDVEVILHCVHVPPDVVLAAHKH